MSKKMQIIPVEKADRAILFIRGKKVMLDTDLAEIYGVTTSRLNEQVKRNIDRFPEEFMFQLTKDEFENLKSQNATSSWGGRRKRPYAFTEHGAVMLAGVLNSPVAVQASIQVVKAFVRLREILATHKELAQKLEQLEKKYDKQFRVVFDAIKKLMTPPSKPRVPIGYRIGRKSKK